MHVARPNSAHASYQQAIADRDLAALNLRRTEVRATVSGFVTNLNLVKGDYASPGKPVLALIDSNSYYVDAYLEETKIPQVKIGSPAVIRLMDGALPLEGKVEGVARGITDTDNHDGPELLDYVNPIFTWVRLAQRIPVRIRLTNIPPDVLVSAGMTCTVVLPDGAYPQIGASAKRLFAAVLKWFSGEVVSSAQAPTQRTASRGPSLMKSCSCASVAGGHAAGMPEYATTPRNGRVWICRGGLLHLHNARDTSSVSVPWIYTVVGSMRACESPCSS